MTQVGFLTSIFHKTTPDQTYEPVLKFITFFDIYFIFQTSVATSFMHDDMKKINLTLKAVHAEGTALLMQNFSTYSTPKNCGGNTETSRNSRDVSNNHFFILCHLQIKRLGQKNRSQLTCKVSGHEQVCESILTDH